jgi:hypothetical protein
METDKKNYERVQRLTGKHQENILRELFAVFRVLPVIGEDNVTLIRWDCLNCEKSRNRKKDDQCKTNSNYGNDLCFDEFIPSFIENDDRADWYGHFLDSIGSPVGRQILSRYRH